MSERSEQMEIPSDALLDCDCARWAENLPKVNAFITFGLSHSMFYEGEQFLFCPWCGKKRIQSNALHDISAERR